MSAWVVGACAKVVVNFQLGGPFPVARVMMGRRRNIILLFFRGKEQSELQGRTCRQCQDNSDKLVAENYIVFGRLTFQP